MLSFILTSWTMTSSAAPDEWLDQVRKTELSSWNFFEEIPEQDISFYRLSAPSVALSCIPQVNISLNQEGFAIITGIMLVNAPAYPPDQYSVDIMGPLSNMVTCAEIGQELMAVVTELPTGNSCMSVLNIEDKLPPVLICMPDTLPCNTDIPSIDFESFLESVSDNCDPDPTIWYSFVVQSLICHPDGLTHRILVTWTATDDFGNSATCIDTIYLKKPTLGEIDFPPNVTINCDETDIDTEPTTTGEPTYEGEPIGFACQFVAFRADVVVQMCAPTYKILRTWTVMDWCSGLSATMVQEILIVDQNSPVIVCPADLTLGTDVGICTTKYTLPVPVELSDACADEEDLVVEITIDANPPIPGFFAPGIMVNLHVGITQITMKAKDPCGNESICIYYITVEDDIPPTIECPDDITIDCVGSTDPESTGYATAIDDCDNNPLVTYEDVTVAADGCAIGYVLTRTWTAEDISGNIASCTQIIVLTDNSAPDITCPADITISCGESTDPAETGFASATDGCDDSPDVTFSDITMGGSCSNEYIIHRTWVATDDCGHVGTCIQVIFIVDDTPPIIECPLDLTIECSTPIPTDLASATDNCSTDITLTYSDIMCINPVVGFNGPYDLSFWTTIIPAEGGSVTLMGENAVMLTSPDITINCDNASVQFSIEITSSGQIVFDWHYETMDVDGPSYDPFGYNLNGSFYQLTNDNGNNIQSGTASVVVTAGDIFALDQRATDCIEGPGATSVVEFFACVEDLDETCTVLIIRTHKATDECNNEATCIQTIFFEDTTSPEITCPAAITIACTESMLPANTGLATATDDCDITPTISYFDITTASQSCVQNYTITRTWAAADACGNSSTCVQIISITDSTPPAILCPDNVTIECDENTLPVNTGIASATDNCYNTPEVTYMDVVSIGACPQAFTITRTWMATDGCGNSMTCEQVIVVDDTTPPIITFCPSNVTIECDESTSPDNTGIASATDNCDSAPEITFVDIVTEGVCTQSYIITRQWTAYDACGNNSICQQTITLLDTTSPVIVCPADVTIDCTDSTDPADIGNALATDNCDSNPVLTYNDIVSPGGCTGEGGIIRIWIATDDCGNSSSCEQNILMIDITPPVINCPADVTIACDENTLPANTGVASATDNCDSAPEVTYIDEYTGGICPQEYSIIRIWMATDACGNSSTCVQAITIEDNTPPIIICPADVTIGCSDSTAPADTGVASATDNCDDNPIFTYSDNIAPGGCSGEGGIVRTWTATDACGNSSTCDQVITVNDNTPPIFTFCPADVTIECTESTSPENTGIASATDNCLTTPEVTFSDQLTDGLCLQEYSIIRTWIATDACGNSSTCLQVILVIDSTAPIITFCPANVTIECDESTSPANLGTASATDNCTDEVDISSNDVVIPSGICPQTYTISRTWTAMDDCGNSTTCVQMISVQDNTIPIISCPADITIECDESTNPANTGLVSATDNCDPAPVITYNDGITVSPLCPQAYTIIRSWTVIDGCGNGTNCIQLISVVDHTPPVITFCPPDVTIECDGDPSTDSNGFAAATDNCDSEPIVDYSDVTTEGNCGLNYTIVRTWTAMDICGNISTCEQIISIEDNTAPICATHDITISEIMDPETGVIYFTAEMIDNESYDECGGPVTISVTPDSLSCVDEGPNVVVLTVTDDCGNTSTCTATVTIDCIDPCVEIVGWVYLSGAAADPTGQPNNFTVPMRTSLNNLQVLPGQSFEDPFFGIKYTPPGQPYSGEPWFYPGTEGNMFDSGGDPMFGDAGYPPTVVDWILVSLRVDSAGTDGPVCQAAALLHNDGHIQFVEEFDCCNLDLYATYYLVIEHRNHLIVMSDELLPIDIGNSTITYDFRIQQSYLDDPFMFGASAQKEILPGIYAMLAANGEQSSSSNADTDINISDRVRWQIENGILGEYRIGDYNLNGDTNFNDRSTWELFNDKFTSVPRD